jgi:hypothetical protein
VVAGDWDNESDENVLESVTLTDDVFELVQRTSPTLPNRAALLDAQVGGFRKARPSLGELRRLHQRAP